MELSKLGETGVIECFGDGTKDADGKPLHDPSAGTYGLGPHVLFDDGSFAWTRSYVIEDGHVENLLEDEPTGWLFYELLADGEKVADDEVAFRGEDAGADPLESRCEYFLEWAGAEGGWTRAKWEDTVGGEWPEWLRDCRAYKHWSPAASHAFEAALVREEG